MSKTLREIQAFPKSARAISEEALAEVKKLHELNAELVAALDRARRDINWMINAQQLLHGFLFNYIDEALAKAKEQA